MKRKVDVTLLGHRFTVRTEKDEAYVHALAAQVTRRIEEVRRQMRNASLQEQALLVALHLADELIEQQERSQSARDELRRHTESMIEKLNAALERDDDGEGAAFEEESGEVAVAAVVSRQA